MHLTIENFKDSKVKERFIHLHPLLIGIAQEMHFFCAEHEQPFVITETVTTKEEDQRFSRVSDSHNQSRAIDVRTKDWPSEFRQKFVDHFDSRYGPTVGAINNTGARKFVVYHDSGFGAHAHCQLDTTFAIKPELT